ncbi:MAG: hypothetical protein P8J50_10530 [Acidimicrobiales bacterium]|nr:hypothetical protein [Acidimicrobiales bacterium]
MLRIHEVLDVQRMLLFVTLAAHHGNSFGSGAPQRGPHLLQSAVDPVVLSVVPYSLSWY